MDKLDPGLQSLITLSAGHPLAVRALGELRWSRAELVEIVRIVAHTEDDAIGRAMAISAVRRMIEVQADRYLKLMNDPAKA